MTAAVLYGREDLKIETRGHSRARRRRSAGARGSRADLRHRSESLEAGLPRAHDQAARAFRPRAGRRDRREGQRGKRRRSAKACAWCRRIRRPAIRASSAARASRISARILLFNNGAYAEYIRIPGRIVRQNMLEIPDDVSFLDAAMVEPLACVLRGIHETGVHAGDTAVVIGCGPIGLKFIRMLSARKVRVIALGKRKSQMRAAERLGAVAAFDVAEIENPVRLVRQLTEGGRGADAVIEAVGPRDHLAMGAANGAQGRHREFVRRLPARHGSEVRSRRAALFRNHHQVDIPSHAAVHPRSAGHDRARRNSRQRFHHRRSSADGVAARVSST